MRGGGGGREEGREGGRETYGGREEAIMYCVRMVPAIVSGSILCRNSYVMQFFLLLSQYAELLNIQQV